MISLKIRFTPLGKLPAPVCLAAFTSASFNSSSFSTGKELPLGAAITDQNNIATNFIQVPNVCRVSFMKGGRLNEYVPQYKMCAITQVDINYTPDGTYATYSDGEMVAIELSLAFQETKLIFAEEVEKY